MRVRARLVRIGVHGARTDAEIFLGQQHQYLRNDIDLHNVHVRVAGAKLEREQRGRVALSGLLSLHYCVCRYIHQRHGGLVQNPGAIPIVVAGENRDGAKGFGDRARDTMLREVMVDTSRLQESLTDLQAQVAQLVTADHVPDGPLRLDGVDVQVEITASGEVRLIGALTAEVKGAITLHFNRQPNH